MGSTDALLYSAALEQQAPTMAVSNLMLTINKGRGWSLESREHETWKQNKQ